MSRFFFTFLTPYLIMESTTNGRFANGKLTELNSKIYSENALSEISVFPFVVVR